MFELNGKNLTVESLVNVARNNTKLKISDDSLSKIKKTREFLNKKVKAKEVIYGVNTGIGEFSEIVLPDDKLINKCPLSFNTLQHSLNILINQST